MIMIARSMPKYVYVDTNSVPLRTSFYKWSIKLGELVGEARQVDN